MLEILVKIHQLVVIAPRALCGYEIIAMHAQAHVSQGTKRYF